MATLTDFLRQAAEHEPHKPALIFQEQTCTYDELYRQSRQLAGSFRRIGIQKGDRAAILLKNSPEFAATVFALSHIGAVAVPINYLQKPDEILYICAHAQVKAIVTQSAYIETVRHVRAQCPSLNKIVITDNTSAQAEPEFLTFQKLVQSPATDAPPECGDEDTVIILYTSGTTGNPKGAMLTHRNLTSNADAAIQAFGLTADEKFLCLLPMFHIFAWTCNVLVPVRLGCPIAIVDSIRPPKPWLQLMRKHRVTVFEAVPQIYAVLAQQAKGLKGLLLRWLFFRTVKFCISGAAPLSMDVSDSFREKLGKTIYEGYGLTETSPLVSVNTPAAMRHGSVGKPVEKVKVKIISEAATALPVGQEGEICVQGPNVMKGYLDLPEETRHSFTPDQWFKTGDIGLLDKDGYLFIKDRIKDMIIVKGLKVFSVQVESALIEHPAVAEAAVVGMPGPDGDETIKAFVVLREGSNTDKLKLLKYCQEKLPAYKRPRDIEIIKELPKNALQKVLKRELRKGGTNK